MTTAKTRLQALELVLTAILSSLPAHQRAAVEQRLLALPLDDEDVDVAVAKLLVGADQGAAPQ